jgi:hypothetical protein
MERMKKTAPVEVIGSILTGSREGKIEILGQMSRCAIFTILQPQAHTLHHRIGLNVNPAAGSGFQARRGLDEYHFQQDSI